MARPPCPAAAWAEWTIERNDQGRDAALRRRPSELVARLPGGEESFLPAMGGHVMQNSVWYRGESLTRLLQGVAVGAVATLVIGFSWGGWVLGSSAKEMAENASTSAVIAAIAPICADQFRASAA